MTKRKKNQKFCDTISISSLSRMRGPSCIYMREVHSFRQGYRGPGIPWGLRMRTFDFSELELVCKQKAMLFGKSGRERLATVVIIDIGKKTTSQSSPG